MGRKGAIGFVPPDVAGAIAQARATAEEIGGERGEVLANLADAVEKVADLPDAEVADAIARAYAELGEAAPGELPSPEFTSVDEPYPPSPWADDEKVARLADPRREVVRVLGERLERLLQPVDEDEAWHGVYAITRKDLDAALLEDLPAASQQAASVRTPAFVYVDAICPVCGIASEVALEIEAKLEATSHGRKVKLAAKAAAKPHICGQQRIRDVTPTRPEAKGQTTLDLGGDVDEGEDVELTEQGAIVPPEADEDLRPQGEVNVDELRGAAERDIAGGPRGGLCDECNLPAGHEGDHDPDALPF